MTVLLFSVQYRDRIAVVRFAALRRRRSRLMEDFAIFSSCSSQQVPVQEDQWTPLRNVTRDFQIASVLLRSFSELTRA